MFNPTSEVGMFSMEPFTLWAPIFPSDELPDEFPKHLRRPIREHVSMGFRFCDAESVPADTEMSEVLLKQAKRQNTSPAPRPYKRLRIPGGHAAIPKQVRAEMDSDDEIIVEMKQQGFKDPEIQKRLLDEGRTRYNPKTISTRWARLKRVMAEEEDRRLDEDLTDWHEGEDELLRDSHEMARLQVITELEAVRQKQWRYTAENLRKLMPTVRYSAKACMERFEALKNGTARVPPELDPNPEARELERIERTRLRDIARAEAAAAAQREEDAKNAGKKKALRAKEMKKEAEAAKKAEIALKKLAEKAASRARQEARANKIKSLKEKAASRAQREKAEKARELARAKLEERMGRMIEAKKQTKVTQKAKVKAARKAAQIEGRSEKELAKELKDLGATAYQGPKSVPGHAPHPFDDDEEVKYTWGEFDDMQSGADETYPSDADFEMKDGDEDDIEMMV